ncbi:WD40-repeat-containing domain protein [Dunaliella salina]|uniref:WD40-repeat-containing domain protein n=1 Tax=Dunaliella salina TaxID=3046 RepID=A0ABQ7FY17_DUNSA|nr:WD40-repeat-containing domain protein [Dunaliella salina]|eukprot:KAF5827248.1 WD40-repeat-containing domain protein [Dunaliella salina]
MSIGKEDDIMRSARKFFQRLKFDPTLPSHEYIIGYLEGRELAHRKSGAEAWSMRIHDVLQEMPYPQFLQKFQEDIPYHRIAHFRVGSIKTWESEYYKKKLALAAEAAGSASSGRRAPSAPFASPSTHVPPPHPSFSGSPMSSSIPALRGRSPSPPTLVGGSSTEDTEDEGDGVVGGSDVEEDSPQWQLELDGEDCQQQQQQQQQDVLGAEDNEEEQEVVLPEACWMEILCQLSVRDVCMTSRVNRWLRQLTNTDMVWQAQHRMVLGSEPPRSALRAARWLEADVKTIQNVGFPDTTCLQLDDSKVVSADGSMLRLWSHTAGRHRRIATLTGHAGRVTSVACNDEHLLSGCTQSVVKLWSMDDLKCRRTLRGHEGPITGALLTQSGIPVTSSEDGRVRLWDISTGAPISDLECEGPVLGLASNDAQGYLVSTGEAGVQIWDIAAATLLHTLDGTSGLERLGGQDGEHANLANLFDLLVRSHPDEGLPPFSCVAFNGNMLAAGSDHEVVLWDSRTQHRVGCLKRKRLMRQASALAKAAPPATAGSPAAAAAAAAVAAAAAAEPQPGGDDDNTVPASKDDDGSSSCSGGVGGSSSGLDPMAGGCCGVQLDEWKLAVSGANGGIALSIWVRIKGSGDYDAVPPSSNGSSSGSKGWDGDSSGLDFVVGSCCGVQLDEWGLAVGNAAGARAAGAEGEGMYGKSPGDGGKAKKKPPKLKKHGRYPKRTTK